MASRKGLVPQLRDWVGADRLEIIDAGTGWPAHVSCKTTTGSVRLAAHLGPIGSSQRGRDDVERRFQNPSKDSPVIAPPGEIPVLLGMTEHQGKRLLVGMDAYKRLGKGTRQSLFMPIELLSAAAESDWAEHYSNAGERLIAFAAPLLPIFIEVYRDQAEVSEAQIQSALLASGESSTSTPAGLERALVVVAKLARDAAFSRNVRSAYGGACAMCGLGLFWVEGAHIYPVSAPGSVDAIHNGIALCRNHHAAFDAFHIHIAPGSGALSLHPQLLKDARDNPACRAFISSTFPTLKRPARRSDWPADDMLVKRYEFFSSKYEWASELTSTKIGALQLTLTD